MSIWFHNNINDRLWCKSRFTDCKLYSVKSIKLGCYLATLLPRSGSTSCLTCEKRGTWLPTSQLNPSTNQKVNQLRLHIRWIRSWRWPYWLSVSLPLPGQELSQTIYPRAVFQQRIWPGFGLGQVKTWKSKRRVKFKALNFAAKNCGRMAQRSSVVLQKKNGYRQCSISWGSSALRRKGSATSLVTELCQWTRVANCEFKFLCLNQFLAIKLKDILSVLTLPLQTLWICSWVEWKFVWPYYSDCCWMVKQLC